MPDHQRHRSNSRKTPFDPFNATYQNPNIVLAAQEILAQSDQTEEEYLGAQAVLFLNDLALDNS